MAEAARRPLPIVDARDAHFVIVEGRYYDDLNDMLIAGAKAAFAASGATCEVITMPGALEIPVAIAIRDDHNPADGYVALGVVIRGETTHYEIVAIQSSRALIDLATHNGMPLGNGILTVENYEQAEVRANPAKGDKGGDAARAALALYALRKGLSA